MIESNSYRIENPNIFNLGTSKSMNPQSYYPSSPHKEFDKFTFTETHTHTDHIPSNIDHFHDDVTTQTGKFHQQIDINLKTDKQQSLTKVRSMPPAQFAQFAHQQFSGADAQMDFQKTDFSYTPKIVEANNQSPFPNRANSKQLNQTLNTNVESRDFLGQGCTPNKTPKMIQKSTSGFIPQIVYDESPQDLRPVITKVQQIHQIPLPNQRVSFQTPQIVSGQQSMPRTSAISIINRPSVNIVDRQSVNALQHNIIPLDSRNVLKSNVTAAETRRQYDSIFIDQQGNQVTTQLSAHPSRQQKFSFMSDTISVPQTATAQQYQQVDIQRPYYRKTSDNKGECYRTAGPQQDYYKEEESCCAKMLPALGVLALIMLVAGTLVGIGALTGLIGGTNFMSRTEFQNAQKVDAGGYSGFATNLVEDGKIEPVINTTPMVVPPIVTNTTTVTTPINVQPLYTPTITPSEPTVNPVQPVKPITQPIPVTPVTQPEIKPSLTPIITPIIPTQPVIKPTPVQPLPVSDQSTIYITQTVTVVTKPLEAIEPTKIQPVKPVVQPTPISQVTKPTTQSTKPAQPSVIQPTIVTPITKPVISPAIQPVVTPIVQPTVTPIVQPITTPTAIPATPLSKEQAQKVITTIMQSNSEVIPLNFQTSIKEDILNEFETVPINFRDVHKVQALTEKHIEKLKANSLTNS